MLPTDSFGWIGFLFQQYGSMFLQGAGTTMLIAVVGTLAGFGIGLLVAIVRTIPVEPKDSPAKKVLLKIVRGILIAYIEIFRGTPMMVQAMVIYYGSAILFNLDMTSLRFIKCCLNTGLAFCHFLKHTRTNQSCQLSLIAKSGLSQE